MGPKLNMCKKYFRWKYFGQLLPPVLKINSNKIYKEIYCNNAIKLKRF